MNELDINIHLKIHNYDMENQAEVKVTIFINDDTVDSNKKILSQKANFKIHRNEIVSENKIV